MKHVPRCGVCSHPDLEQIHADRYGNKMFFPALALKYFPKLKPKTAERKLCTHFKKHYNINEIVTATQEALSTGAGIPLTSNALPVILTNQRVFAEQALQRISAVLVLESLLRNVMEKINVVEDEWVQAHTASVCENCGRDDTGPTLAKMITLMREARELNAEWVKVKDPMEVVKQFFGMTFERFTGDITTVYLQALNDKNLLMRLAINQLVSGEISQTVLVRRMSDIEDAGTPKLAEQAALLATTILKEALREIDALR